MDRRSRAARRAVTDRRWPRHRSIRTAGSRVPGGCRPAGRTIPGGRPLVGDGRSGGRRRAGPCRSGRRSGGGTQRGAGHRGGRRPMARGGALGRGAAVPHQLLQAGRADRCRHLGPGRGRGGRRAQFGTAGRTRRPGGEPGRPDRTGREIRVHRCRRGCGCADPRLRLAAGDGSDSAHRPLGRRDSALVDPACGGGDQRADDSGDPGADARHRGRNRLRAVHHVPTSREPRRWNGCPGVRRPIACHRRRGGCVCRFDGGHRHARADRGRSPIDHDHGVRRGVRHHRRRRGCHHAAAGTARDGRAAVGGTDAAGPAESTSRCGRHQSRHPLDHVGGTTGRGSASGRPWPRCWCWRCRCWTSRPPSRRPAARRRRPPIVGHTI